MMTKLSIILKWLQKTARLCPLHGQNGEMLALGNPKKRGIEATMQENQAARMGENIADTPKIYITPQSLTRRI